MNEETLDILIHRIEKTVASGNDYKNIFELRKTRQNVDYAQRVLLQVELDDPYADLATARKRIRDLQGSLAEAELVLDDLPVSESESEPEMDMNALPPSVASEKAEVGIRTQEHVLQNHRETQETITDDLLTMAQTLRLNQAKFGESISRDEALIEKTGEALQVNAGRMKTTGARLGQYVKTSHSMCKLSVGAILVAMVSFFIMYGVIRLT